MSEPSMLPADADISELMDRLTPDPGRELEPFSADIEVCHREIFEPGKTRSEIEGVLRKWLKTSPNQPCLFG